MRERSNLDYLHGSPALSLLSSRLQVTEPTSSIVLNSVALAVTNGSITFDSQKIPVKDIREKYDERIEFLFNQVIPKGIASEDEVIDLCLRPLSKEGTSPKNFPIPEFP